MDIIALITDSGRVAFELAFFVLLPLITVMTILLAVFSKVGLLGMLERVANLMIRFTGVSGLSFVAFLQMNFVSFAAPISTLKLMDRYGQPDRIFAATLVLILSSSQANLLFPLGAYGLDIPATALISTGCSFMAAIATYHAMGWLKLGNTGNNERIDSIRETRGLLQIIVDSGHEAYKTVLNTLPLLMVSILLVAVLQQVGVVAVVLSSIESTLISLSIDPDFSLAILTKYIAGGSASLNPISELAKQGLLTEEMLNRHVGMLINSFDFPGLAIMLSCTPKVGKVIMYAVPGIILALLLRSSLHLLLF